MLPPSLSTKLLALSRSSGFPDTRLYPSGPTRVLWSPRGLWSLTFQANPPGGLQPQSWTVSFERALLGPSAAPTIVLSEWGVLAFLQKSLSAAGAPESSGRSTP